MSMAEAPRGGRTLRIDLDGPLHCVDYGGEGPPLVLVHGLGGSHLNWMLVAPSLARHFRVIAVDLPGFGLSPPAGRSSQVAAQAALLARLIHARFHEPAFVAGNSMGGLIALLLAERTPDDVRGLILVDPALPPMGRRLPTRDTVQFLATPLLPVVGPSLVERMRNSRSVAEHVAATLDFVTADPTRLPPEVRQAGEEMEAARRAMPWSIPAFVDAGRSIGALLLRRRAFLSTIHRIGCPVLVIHGAEDEVVPVDSADWLVAQRPDWDLIVLDDIGHVPQLEAPATFVGLVAEWAQQPAGSPPPR